VAKLFLKPLMAMFPIKRPPILTILIKAEFPDRKDQARKTFNA